MKSLASSDRSCGNEGSVGCVAILNKAAIGSNSDHGGFVVNISTTVQPRLLEMPDKQLQKENSPNCFGYISYKLPVENFVFVKNFCDQTCFLLIVPFEFVTTQKREKPNPS